MDFYEIDFLDVESEKSGDAICIRYSSNDQMYIQVVDGGYIDTGRIVVNHLNTHYGNPFFIDHVVVTHPDGDHAGGLRKVLESFHVGALWVLRPWLYANQLLHRFGTYSSADRLASRLRALYPHLATLEEIALAKGIPMHEPLQGARIGAFAVLAPSLPRYLDLVVASEKTPEESAAAQFAPGLEGIIARLQTGIKTMVHSAWAHEFFSPFETSAENEMSVVQYGQLCGESILLTGDAGRGALLETLHFASRIGIQLPGIRRFQVPHHGSRRNVSTDLLDALLGPRMAGPCPAEPRFYAYISSAKADKAHPRNAVVRAMFHRWGQVAKTEGNNIRFGWNLPPRAGYGPIPPVAYPATQELD